MTLVYILIAALLGFYLGVRSKAMPRRKNNLPDYRNPPPPLPTKKVGLNHVSPGIMYVIDTFVTVCECSNCGAIGHDHDMYTHNPCPKCGGRVEESSSAAKWSEIDGVKQWIKSEI